jgi:hypothetical protein
MGSKRYSCKAMHLCNGYLQNAVITRFLRDFFGDKNYFYKKKKEKNVSKKDHFFPFSRFSYKKES